MKKNCLFIALLLSCFNTHAQRFVEFYMANNYQDYKGCLVKVNEAKNEDYFYYTFYKGLPERKADTHLAIPKRDDLLNKVFRVDSVFTYKYFPSNTATEKEDAIFFKLVEPTTNEVLFYRYDPANALTFHFLVANYKIKESSVEKEISRKADTATGNIAISSPTDKNVILVKTIEKGKVSYFLYLIARSAEKLALLTAGATVQFTDGTKWNRPNAKIEVENKDNWEYSALILLTPQDMALFQTKNIESFKLYNYPQTVDFIDSEKMKVYVLVIKKMK